jgi:hypothetical protein
MRQERCPASQGEKSDAQPGNTLGHNVRLVPVLPASDSKVSIDGAPVNQKELLS